MSAFQKVMQDKNIKRLSTLNTTNMIAQNVDIFP